MQKLLIENANKHTHKPKSIEVVLKYSQLGNFESVQILCFSDVSVANLKSGSSLGDMLFFGSDSMAWKSNKLKRVFKSTLLAETLALEEGL